MLSVTIDLLIISPGFLQRAPIDKASTLVERILSAHGSRRVLSYFEAGCANSHDSVQHVSKCKPGRI